MAYDTYQSAQPDHRFNPRHGRGVRHLPPSRRGLDVLVALRILQGFAGAALLVAGQAIIFLNYPRSHQPILQALFAMGSVVAPATIAPALQGWLLDSHSWAWIFFAVVPVAMAATGLMLLADGPPPAETMRRPFDWIG